MADYWPRNNRRENLSVQDKSQEPFEQLPSNISMYTPQYPSIYNSPRLRRRRKTAGLRPVWNSETAHITGMSWGRQATWYRL